MKTTEEVIKDFREKFHGWFLDCDNLNLDGDSEKELEAFILTAIKEAEERGKETGIRQVGKWIKFPYRKGMKITKNIDGTGGLVNAGCEVCGGKLVSIRPQYPNGKKRNVCPTCATEMIESLYSNCNNRDAYTDKK